MNRPHFVRHLRLPMVVGNLDVISIAIFPIKANPPLVVDANAIP
jgi:hypothetical protein